MSIRDYMSQQEEQKNTTTQATNNTESSGQIVDTNPPTNGVVSTEVLPNDDVVAPPPIGSVPYAQRHRESRQSGIPTGQGLSVQEMYDYLSGSSYEDPEKEKKRKKREYTNKVIAAIGDGLGAISNMVTTSAGADNMHDPKNDILPAMQARYETLNQQREAKKQAWLSGKLKARQMDMDEAYKQSQSAKNKAQENYYIRQNQKMDDEQENKIEELENAKKKIDAEINAKQAQIDQAKADAEEKKRYHDELLELQREKNRLQAEANRIRSYAATTGRIRAEKYEGGSGGTKKGTTPTITVSEQYVGTGANRRKIGETVTTKKPAQPTSGGGNQKRKYTGKSMTKKKK